MRRVRVLDEGRAQQRESAVWSQAALSSNSGLFSAWNWVIYVICPQISILLGEIQLVMPFARITVCIKCPLKETHNAECVVPSVAGTLERIVLWRVCPLFLQEETEGREQCDMPRIPQMSWETAAIKAPYFLDPQPFLGHQAALCTTLYKAGMCYCTFFSLFPGGKGAIHRSKGKGMEVNLRMNVKDLITEDGKAW